MTAVSPYLKLPLRTEVEILQAREQHRRAIAEAMSEAEKRGYGLHPSTAALTSRYGVSP